MCNSMTVGQQIICERCNLTWDINDKKPPQCLSDFEINKRRGLKRLAMIREELREFPTVR